MFPALLTGTLGLTSVACAGTEKAPPAAAENDTSADAATWLGRIEAAATDVHSLKARARLTSVTDLTDETVVRFGELLYKAGEPEQAGRFAVRFTRIMIDDRAEDLEKSYVFDGRYLLELDRAARTATRRELVKEGEQANLELGDGPFALPLNLKRDRVLARFNVELIPPPAEAPPGDAELVHLQLKPKPEAQVEAESIDLWFDRVTLLPRRAASVEDDGDVQTLDLFNPEPNAELPAAAFVTDLPPAAAGWQLQDVPKD